MTYLELCQLVKEKAGITGNNLSTVTGQSGELKRVCNWVKEAWVDVQEHRDDWDWMRNDFTFNTIAYQSTYDPGASPVSLTDFAKWRDDSFRIYYTASGVGTETLLQQYEYNSFRDYYLLGARKATFARPIALSIKPNRSLVLGLAPNDIFTVSGEYFKTPQILAADGDIPEMPSRFHLLIAYRALIKYGYYESAGEVIQEYTQLYNEMLNKLELDQGQAVILGPSMI